MESLYRLHKKNYSEHRPKRWLFSTYIPPEKPKFPSPIRLYSQRNIEYSYSTALILQYGKKPY